jgi:hypothetical protein
MRASSSGTLAANAGADDPGATNHVDFQIEFVPADGIRLPFSEAETSARRRFRAALSQGNPLDREANVLFWLRNVQRVRVQPTRCPGTMQCPAVGLVAAFVLNPAHDARMTALEVRAWGPRTRRPGSAPVASPFL